MVVAQIPLWIQHSTGSTPATLTTGANGNPSLDARSNHNPWNNTRRSAIYAVDIAGPRIATGGGDGMVRIWSIDALFSSSKSLNRDGNGNGTKTKMAQFSQKGYTSSDTSDGDTDADIDAGNGDNDIDNDNDNGDNSDTHSQSSRKSSQQTSSKKRKRNEADFSNQHNSATTPNRLLCKISSHSGSVLTLRFSPSQTILASAGDDSHVILYAQSSTPSIAATGNLMDDSDNVEHWNRIRICRGHNLDVVGLAWAPDDSHLISCSLDSDAPICVWRMDFEKHGYGPSAAGHTIMQPYKVLGVKEHTSTVKGVAFDPAGKYIASSGDDPSLCIWRAFDDWGLESRIDSSSGIFQQDVQSLANLSMFRRISFAPDGTHVCATNAMLRKKNIAAMVSRDGWGVSAKKNVNVAGAANLVGHKQPVVSSRHCPFLFGKLGGDDERAEEPGQDEDGEDLQPDYSTLVALGDKKGFVTIWSTRKSRPIFKLQCSESRCTVTDMAWGLMPSSSWQSSRSLVMLISLLDGFTVALRFDTDDEIGPILTEEKKCTIFRLKYGIDLSSLNDTGASRRRLVDDTSGPKLIENVLQYEMEENDEEMQEAKNETTATLSNGLGNGKKVEQPKVNTLINVRKKQVESRSRLTGKKRIQPVLMTDHGNSASSPSANLEKRMNGIDRASPTEFQQNKDHSNGRDFVSGKTTQTEERTKPPSVAAGSNGHALKGRKDTGQTFNTAQHPLHRYYDNVSIAMQPISTSLPTVEQKIYSVDLHIPRSGSVLENNTLGFSGETRHKTVASCSNSIQSPPGINGNTSCATLSISCGSEVSWKDHLMGTHCTALDACSSFIALGSYDGTIYLYSTSPSLGWESGVGFRSHPPFVMNGSIVRLSLKEEKESSGSAPNSVEMLVLTADGAFSVFSVVPKPKLLLKGTIMPAMNQMRLSSCHRTQVKDNDASLFPELAKIMFTESKDLLLILCHKAKATIPVGGLLQGFVYNKDMEAWMRISDGRFMFSTLFSTFPSSNMQSGLLSKIDRAVSTSGNRSSTSRRGMRTHTSASENYYINEDDESSLQSFSTKAHCEDRLACALVLQSKPDFDHWLRLYARTLSAEANTVHLRMLVDMLLGKASDNDPLQETTPNESSTFWWLQSAKGVLEDPKSAIEEMIIPEMSKNRSLQRLTNEFATEMKSL